jgi:uncharacterized membrane protein SirB2
MISYFINKYNPSTILNDTFSFFYKLSMMYITTCITILVCNQLVAKNFLLYIYIYIIIIFFSIKGSLDLSEGVKFQFGYFL